MGKLDVLRKLAKMGAAGGAATLMSQEEAQAAGIATIMRKLGVAADEARKIKEMAKTVSGDVFDENIRKIQSVRKYVEDPKQFEQIGAGIESEVFDLGTGDVIKVPKRTRYNTTAIEDYLAPAIVEDVGLGPKTRIVDTSKTKYQVQEKLKPYDTMPWVKDPEYKGIEDQIDQVWKEIEKHNAQFPIDVQPETPEHFKAQLRKLGEAKQGIIDKYVTETQESPNIQKLLEQFEDTFPGQSLPIEEIARRPGDIAAEIAEMKAMDELDSVITPEDIHRGNVAATPEGDIKIIDTGLFRDPRFENMSESMKENIKASYIGSPEKKKYLQDLINRKVEMDPFRPDQRLEDLIEAQKVANRKKIAGAAGAATLAGSMAPEEAEAGIIPRNVAAKLIQAAKTDQGLDLTKLKESLEMKPDEFAKNLEKMQDVLGHEILEKTGRTESQIMRAVQDMHPELDLNQITKILPDEEMTRRFSEFTLGAAGTPEAGNMFRRRLVIDPENTQIFLRKSIMDDPARGAALVGHEAQHGKDIIHSPERISIPYSVTDLGRAEHIVKGNPELFDKLIENYNKVASEMGKRTINIEDIDLEKLSLRDMNHILTAPGAFDIYKAGYKSIDAEPLMDTVLKGHHIEYPEGYEFEKLKELADYGVIDDPLETAYLKGKKAKLSKDFRDAMEQVKAKKAAAVAPIGAMQQDEEESVLDRILSAGQEYAGKGLEAAGEYYRSLDPETQENIEAGLEHLSRPSGALRGAVRAAQEDITDVSLTEPSAIGQGLLEGWMDPYEAPTGADIAEAMNLPDENVVTKTAVSTAADFADPIDFLGLGGAMKAKKLLGR